MGYALVFSRGNSMESDNSVAFLRFTLTLKTVIRRSIQVSRKNNKERRTMTVIRMVSSSLYFVMPEK